MINRAQVSPKLVPLGQLMKHGIIDGVIDKGMELKK